MNNSERRLNILSANLLLSFCSSSTFFIIIIIIKVIIIKPISASPGDDLCSTIDFSSTPVHPHAQSLFLFPIVFGINLIKFFDVSEVPANDKEKPFSFDVESILSRRRAEETGNIKVLCRNFRPMLSAALQYWWPGDEHIPTKRVSRGLKKQPLREEHAAKGTAQGAEGTMSAIKRGGDNFSESCHYTYRRVLHGLGWPANAILFLPIVL